MKKIFNYVLILIITLVVGFVSVKAEPDTNFSSYFYSSITSEDCDDTSDCQTNWRNDNNGQAVYSHYGHGTFINEDDNDSMRYLIDTRGNSVFCLDRSLKVGYGMTRDLVETKKNEGLACVAISVWKNNGVVNGHHQILAGQTFTALSKDTNPSSLNGVNYVAIQTAIWKYNNNYPDCSSVESRTKTENINSNASGSISVDNDDVLLKLNADETEYISSKIIINFAGTTDYDDNGTKYYAYLTNAPEGSYLSATLDGASLTTVDGTDMFKVTGSELYLKIPVAEESYDINNIRVTVQGQYATKQNTTADAISAKYGVADGTHQTIAVFHFETKSNYEYNSISDNATFSFDTKKITISKHDITNENEIEGAEIVIKDKETGDMVHKYTSTKEPHELYLAPGRYTLEELIAPEGYQKVETVFEFEVSSTGKVTLLGTESNLIKANGSDIVLYNKLYEVEDTAGTIEKIYFFISCIFVIAGGTLIYLVTRQRKLNNTF